MSTVARLKQAVKILIPAISLVIGATLTEACYQPQKEQVNTSKAQSSGKKPATEAISVNNELELLQKWAKSSDTEKINWTLSPTDAASGLLDVETNALGWFDAGGNLAEAPSVQEARRMKEAGLIKQVGVLANRYRGKAPEDLKRLREEFTQVAGCFQPAICYSLTTIIRGAPRDPEAGPVPIEYVEAESALGPDSQAIRNRKR